MIWYEPQYALSKTQKLWVNQLHSLLRYGWSTASQHQVLDAGNLLVNSGDN